MSSLKGFFGKGFLRLFDLWPRAALETFIGKLITNRAKALGPEEGLRFLFRLDSLIYGLEGGQSVEYGQGVHTKHRHTRYHDFFVGRIQTGQRVLDVGCGNGALTYDLASRSEAEVVGIDKNEKNIRLAQERHSHPRATYLAGDATQDLPAGAFDVVVMSNVLEHLPDRPEFLRRLAEASQAKRFLIRVPLYERDWRVPLRHELGVEWRLDQTHETEYTLESFAEEMAAARLETVHLEVRWGEIWAELQTAQKGRAE